MQFTQVPQMRGFFVYRDRCPLSWMGGPYADRRWRGEYGLCSSLDSGLGYRG